MSTTPDMPPTGQPPNPNPHRKPWMIAGLVAVALVTISVVNGVITGGEGYGNAAAAGTSLPSSTDWGAEGTETLSDKAMREFQEQEARTAVEAPSGPVTSISDAGTYVVGTDIAPGTYRSAGPDGSNFMGCYWARLENTTGDLGSIAANHLGDGPAVVTIKSGDAAFKTSGCQVWTKAN